MQHPLVVAHHYSKVATQPLRRRQVERIEAAQLVGGQKRGRVEESVIDPKEVETFYQRARSSDGDRTLLTYGAHNFDTGKSARASSRMLP